MVAFVSISVTILVVYVVIEMISEHDGKVEQEVLLPHSSRV